MKTYKYPAINTAVILFSALLLGCGSGGGGGGPSFMIVGGGGTEASETTGCAGCTVSNLNAVADTSDSTKATMNFSAVGDGAISIRVDAQAGIVYPAGSQVAVRWGIPQPSTSFSATLQTYMGDAPGDTYTIRTIDGNSRPAGYSSAGDTLSQFDAIEITVRREGGAGGEDTVDVFAFGVN